MTLAKGVNSNATVEEAELYFADRLDVAAWVDADATQKPQSLVTATSILDDLSWTGIASSETQLTAFPRIGDYFDPRLGTLVSINGTPSRVIIATYELAYHLLNNDGLLDSTGGVDDLSMGPVKLVGIKATSRLPSHVRRLIKPLLINAGARTWWRAN